MAMDPNQTGEQKTGMGHAASPSVNDLDGQRLRILHCAGAGQQPRGLALQGGHPALAGGASGRTDRFGRHDKPTQKCPRAAAAD